MRFGPHAQSPVVLHLPRMVSQRLPNGIVSPKPKSNHFGPRAYGDTGLQVTRYLVSREPLSLPPSSARLFARPFLLNQLLQLPLPQIEVVLCPHNPHPQMTERELPALIHVIRVIKANR